MNLEKKILRINVQLVLWDICLAVHFLNTVQSVAMNGMVAQVEVWYWVLVSRFLFGITPTQHFCNVYGLSVWDFYIDHFERFAAHRYAHFVK